MTPRIVIHVDLDYFYAQCEEIADSQLRGKPLVVCVFSGRTADSGVVSTSNYEARKYGVRAGIPIVRAKKLLDSIESTFLPMNKALYQGVSDRIMEILRAHADAFERTSIDEAYLDVSALTEGSFDRAKQLAFEIKGEIQRKEQITCSIGVASNKLIAKIASDHNKPDGLTIIEPKDTLSFITPLPVTSVPGVGRKVEEKLTELKVQTIEELSLIDPSVLIEKFGKRLGTYLFQSARGEDNDAVIDRDEPTQISRIGTLKQNTRRADEVLPLLSGLADSVSQKLMESGMKCRSVSFIAILEDLSIHTRTVTLEVPTNDREIIIETAKTLLDRFIDTMPNLVIRRVGVKVSGLSTPSGQTDMTTFLQAK